MDRLRNHCHPIISGTVHDSVILLNDTTRENLVTIKPGVQVHSLDNAEKIEFEVGDMLVNSQGQGSIHKVKSYPETG